LRKAGVFLAAINLGLNTVFLVFIIADVKNKTAAGLKLLGILANS
jgi:hypothetical protein